MKPRFLWGVLVTIFLLFSLGAVIWWVTGSSSSTHSHGKALEVRKYDSILLPLDGTTLEARTSQIKFRLTKPGQAKLADLATKGAKPLPLQEAFAKLGYEFPSGTYVDGGGCTSPGMSICHYPDMLDRIEEDFQLERSP